MQITIMIPFLCIIPFAALSDKLCNRPNSILSICLNRSQDDLNFIYVIITILFFLLFIYSFLRIFNVDFSSSFLKNSSPLVLKMFEIFIQKKKFGPRIRAARKNSKPPGKLQIRGTIAYANSIILTICWLPIMWKILNVENIHFLV